LPIASLPNSWFRRLLGIRPSPLTALQAIADKVPVDHLTLSRSSKLPYELLAMDERQVIRSYKFGICYLKPGQTTEAEMLTNDWGKSNILFLLNYISSMCL
jgi:RAP1 GTPase activating protein 1